jgi:hypothetical protein
MWLEVDEGEPENKKPFNRQEHDPVRNFLQFTVALRDDPTGLLLCLKQQLSRKCN